MTDKTNTPDEIVDVVNDKDEVIGQSTKGEVNSNPNVIHREVGILIYNTEGKILIQQRSAKKKAYPLYWMISVAGHVPAGMSPIEAAHKELVEELGFDTDLKLYEKMFLKYPYETQFCYGYIGKIPDNAKVVIDPHETESYKFINSQDLQNMIAAGEKLEQYSIDDFNKFFSGQFDSIMQS